MSSNDHTSADAFGETPKQREEARAYRVREAPDHLPPSLKVQINEHRQEQEKVRENLVQSIEKEFPSQVEAEKQHLQRRFEHDLDRQAVQQAQKHNRYQLENFDRDNMKEEWNIVQVYEMSLQSKSVRPPKNPSHSQAEDRKPGRER